ncbi:CHRD domain-containing protein [Nocardioides xinjiangensis]|uniref:CHRD domain-containing protein n=1 Tax=Nocardioides xinjiangensis TaxID=2817376 RepID=UPI001B302BB7|nr:MULTISPECIES: CHRD domain-containing protein [unclassified Nocardioides]
MARRVLALLVLVVAALVGGASAASAEVRVITVHLAPSGDADGSGVATLRLRSDQELVCYSIVVRDIGVPTEPAPGIGSAHIHGPLPAGGIAIDLDTVFRAAGPSTYVARDCVSADSDAIDAVLADPELFYLNVHNVEFPGGAVQGSLDRAGE